MWFPIKFRLMTVRIKPITRRALWHALAICSSSHELPQGFHLVLLSIASEFVICFLQLVSESLLMANYVDLLLLCLRWWSAMRSQVYLLLFLLQRFRILRFRGSMLSNVIFLSGQIRNNKSISICKCTIKLCEKRNFTVLEKVSLRYQNFTLKVLVPGGI